MLFLSGTITTAAGIGIVPFGFSGDGGPATSAQLYFPTGVAVDGAGNLFIVDSVNQRIRKVSAACPRYSPPSIASLATTSTGAGGTGGMTLGRAGSAPVQDQV